MSLVCGIAGIMAEGPREALEPVLHRMLGALRHRGPDDSGCEAFPGSDGRAVTLGCTRLAILDPSLAGYVRFGSVPDPLTLLDGVLSLPAGHWMRVRAGGVTDVRSYWRADRFLGAPATAPAADAAHEVRERLERSVGEHLLSDVAVAAFLSGGLDSSIVTALAARASPRPLRTFTVGFRERQLDESAGARSVADRYATDHHPVDLADAEAASLVPAAVLALDLPSADGVNTFVVSRAAARDGVKVVLSGLGGDELFGGYRTFRLLSLAERWSGVLGVVPSGLRRLAARGGSGERAAEMTARGATLADRYETLRSFWSRGELAAMGLEGVGYGAEDPGPGVPAATRISVLELGGYLRSTLLRDADAMSMAHSLELRVPFLDHALVESCLRHRAAGPGGARGHKALLKRAAGDLLPRAVTRGPKRGFVLPMERWMRGPLRGFVGDGVAALQESRVLPALDTRSLVARFESRRLPWSRVWELAVLGHWLDRHGLGA